MKKQAITAMLLAALSFSLMGVFVKLSGDLPIVQKSLFRSLVTLMVAWFTVKGQGLELRAVRHPWLLTLRCVAGTLGILLNFYALDHLVLSDANVIIKFSTVFVVILSWLFLKERIGRYHVLSLAMALAGVLLVIKPSFSSDLMPFAIALLGSLSAAVAYTTLRALGDKEKPATIVFVFSLFSVLVLLPFVLLNYAPMSPAQWCYVLLAGVFAAGGQMGITYAYRLAPAKSIAIYDYYGVVFSALLGFAFFGSLPDGFSLLGYITIFLSSYLLHKKESI